LTCFAARVNTFGVQEWQEEIQGAVKCKANVGVDLSAGIMHTHDSHMHGIGVKKLCMKTKPVLQKYLSF
jgi:hypothetical protein